MIRSDYFWLAVNSPPCFPERGWNLQKGTALCDTSCQKWIHCEHRRPSCFTLANRNHHFRRPHSSHGNRTSSSRAFRSEQRCINIWECHSERPGERWIFFPHDTNICWSLWVQAFAWCSLMMTIAQTCSAVTVKTPIIASELEHAREIFCTPTWHVMGHTNWPLLETLLFYRPPMFSPESCLVEINAELFEESNPRTLFLRQHQTL